MSTTEAKNKARSLIGTVWDKAIEIYDNPDIKTTQKPSDALTLAIKREFNNKTSDQLTTKEWNAIADKVNKGTFLSWIYPPEAHTETGVNKDSLYIAKPGDDSGIDIIAVILDQLGYWPYVKSYKGPGADKERKMFQKTQRRRY